MLQIMTHPLFEMWIYSDNKADVVCEDFFSMVGLIYLEIASNRYEERWKLAVHMSLEFR